MRFELHSAHLCLYARGAKPIWGLGEGGGVEPRRGHGLWTNLFDWCARESEVGKVGGAVCTREDWKLVDQPGFGELESSVYDQ